MYACICKNITERQVHNAVLEGHCSMKALRKKFGIMTQCGKCAKATSNLLREVLAKQ